MVTFLMNKPKQFGCYNIYQSDSTVDLELFNSDITKLKICSPNHAFILRPVYEICNEMKFYNLTMPLSPDGEFHDMFMANPNPMNYEVH